ERLPMGLCWLLRQDLKQSGPVLRLMYALPPVLRSAVEAGRPVPFRRLHPSALAQVRRSLIQGADRNQGYEGEPTNGQSVVPGRGFEEEDRLEAAWGHGVLLMRRTPAAWGYTSHYYLQPEDLAHALLSERAVNPKATDRDVHRIEGEKLEVVLQVPGVLPVV